jgi:hypothetical protein
MAWLGGGAAGLRVKLKGAERHWDDPMWNGVEAPAGFDEGLLSLSLSNSLLYGESLKLQEMPVTNNSAPSYIHAGWRP